jgi:hypothetical protein
MQQILYLSLGRKYQAKDCEGIMSAKKLVGGVFILTMLAMSASTEADAAPNFTTGTLTSIGSGWGGEGIYMFVSPAISPACNGAVYMSTSAIQYKENLALAMLALSQSLRITIYYSATCNASGSVDLVSLTIG